MVSRNLKVTDRQIADFCRRNHIRRLSFFGSVVRDDFGPDSDVDVLVEFESEYRPGLKIIDIEDEFSQLLGGHRVDLVNPKYINPRLRDQILAEAVLQYAE